MLRARDDLNLAEAFELARETIRSLMLINGGGAAAVLAFFGNLLTAQHAPALDRRYVFAALVVFALGLVLGTVTSLIGYRVQIRWGGEVPDSAGDLATYDAATMRLSWWAVGVGLGSLTAFVTGVMLSALALF